MYMALEDAWLPVLHCQRSDCMGSYRTLFKNVSNLISATPYNSLFMLQLLCVLVPAIIWFSSISVWEKNQRQWFARGVRLHWWRCRERWRGSSNKKCLFCHKIVVELSKMQVVQLYCAHSPLMDGHPTPLWLHKDCEKSSVKVSFCTDMTHKDSWSKTVATYL